MTEHSKCLFKKGKFEEKVKKLLDSLQTTLEKKRRQRKYGMQHLTEGLLNTMLLLKYITDNS